MVEYLPYLCGPSITYPRSTTGHDSLNIKANVLLEVAPRGRKNKKVTADKAGQETGIQLRRYNTIEENEDYGLFFVYLFFEVCSGLNAGLCSGIIPGGAWDHM